MIIDISSGALPERLFAPTPAIDRIPDLVASVVRETLSHGRSICALTSTQTGTEILIGFAIGLWDSAAASAILMFLHVHLGAGGDQVACAVYSLDHYLKKISFIFTLGIVGEKQKQCFQKVASSCLSKFYGKNSYVHNISHIKS